MEGIIHAAAQQVEVSITTERVQNSLFEWKIDSNFFFSFSFCECGVNRYENVKEWRYSKYVS